MVYEYERPPLAPYQTAVIDCPKRFTISEWTTKGGKTVSHIVWLFEQALKPREDAPPGEENNKEGMNYWWVAPIFPQAKIAFKRMQMFVGIKGFFKTNLSELTLILPNKAEIHFKSADNHNSLYGENVYAAVFDEFTRAKEESWFALRSTLTVTRAKCKLIGNYTGSTNWGHKLSEKAKDPKGEYAYFNVDALQAVKAGILNQEEVDQARKDLPKTIFEALYLAKGSVSGDILFPSEAVSDLFTNDFVKEGKERWMTADIATYGSDRFVVGIWFGLVLKKVYVIDKCEADEVERFLKAKATEWGIPRSNIVYDADGIGSFLRGYLKDARPFNGGATPIQEGKDNVNYLNLNAQCWFHLSKKVNDHEIYIEDEDCREDVERELELIRQYKADKEGKLRATPKDEIKKLLGYSPDYADMLKIRMLPELKVQKPLIKVLGQR